MYHALKLIPYSVHETKIAYLIDYKNSFYILLQGRKARLKVTRSSTAAQNRYSRGSPVSTYSPYSNSTSTSRLSNGTPGFAGEEYSNGTYEEEQ